jgi:AcrR family transcriptional regulator
MERSLINRGPLGRPVTIDDSKLLEAAQSVFLEKGAAATTEEVARRAGISQASIFKRFKTKQELFLAAMHVHRRRQRWIDLLQQRAPEIGLRAALIEVGVEIAGFLEKIFPLILVSWSNRGEFGFAKSSTKEGPVRGIQELAEFLEREMDAGRLNRVDSWSACRAFAGSIHSYVLMSLFTKNGIGPRWNPKDYVTGVVDVLWAGLDPRAPAPLQPKATPRSQKKR